MVSDLEERQTDVLLGWVEDLVTQASWPLTPRKRVVRAAIEMLQNLVKHARSSEFACVLEQSGTVLLSSQNVVNAKEREVLEAAIDQAESIPHTELRQERLAKLAHGERTEKGGAGLGFLDLRACSSGSIHTEFIPCGNQQSYFLLHVRIHPTP